VPETTSSAPQPAYTVSSLGVVVLGFRTSIRKTAGTGRFALFAIAAVTRKMSPGATESGTPSTVNVTAKPFTCTSFDTVLLRVGVRMPTALAANKTTTKIVARGPSLMPFLPIVRTSPASPRRFGWPTWARGDNPAAAMHRARRWFTLAVPSALWRAELSAERANRCPRSEGFYWRGRRPARPPRRPPNPGRRSPIVRDRRVPDRHGGRPAGSPLQGIGRRGGPRHRRRRPCRERSVSGVAASCPAARGERPRGGGSRGRHPRIPRQRVRVRPPANAARHGRSSAGAAHAKGEPPVGR